MMPKYRGFTTELFAYMLCDFLAISFLAHSPFYSGIARQNAAIVIELLIFVWSMSFVVRGVRILATRERLHDIAQTSRAIWYIVLPLILGAITQWFFIQAMMKELN
jgi:uncharacterized membrane protein YhaH (DUF805 family)